MIRMAIERMPSGGFVVFSGGAERRDYCDPTVSPGPIGSLTGVVSDGAPEIVSSLGQGITFVDLGFIQISIPESRMKMLRPGTRRASMTMTDSVNTRQLFIAQLPIISGGVTN
jgi:hypothetical protein